MIWNEFVPLIQKFTKIYKKSQNLLKVLPKTVLFRNIALIFNLENRVVREGYRVSGGVPVFEFLYIRNTLYQLQ